MPSEYTVEPHIQYASLEHQGDSAQDCMWVFLATETVFFGAIIFTYFLYRVFYSAEFDVAGKDAVFWCGSVNIGILLTSSLTMVLAVNSGAQGRRRAMIWWLIATMALGFIFMAVKGYEYYQDFTDRVVPAVNFLMKPEEAPAGELFWDFYWIATALHAIHLTIGLALIAYVLLWRIRRGEITPEYYQPLEVIAIYWSFVDTVWLFLYPSIYLLGRS
ncbi:MAG TPA: cytochrome c oxidase subunit 3 [Stellaceae bacterium]|nr:cytochrome c oxidase subunit 3 [Stellaceae bacterium]